MTPLQCRTMSSPASITAAARCSNEPVQRLHRQVVAQDEAVEPDLSTHDFRNHGRRRRRRTPSINRRVKEMGAHRHRQVFERRKWREIVAEIAARGVDDRQLVMAVHARPAMPRHVLDDGRDPAGKQPIGDRSTHRRDSFGPRRESSRADGRMHALVGDIEDRRAVDRDSDLDEIMSDEAGDKTRRRLGLGWLQARFYRARSRVRTPMRGAIRWTRPPS